jgi:ubiquinone/menaquinone biosynthesis C-methylase UbiE
MKQEEVWDEVAEKWASYRKQPVDEVLEFLEGKSGLVLDLGCGSGRNFIYSDGLDIYGVDFSSELLKIAEGCGYKELKKADVSEIPYRGEFFDFVVFVRVLHCVEGEEKKRKIIEEIYRVLKDGGEAVISTIGWKNQRVKNKPKDGVLPWTVGDVKYERYNYVYEFDEFLELLKSVGFEIVKSWENKNSLAIVRKSSS